MVLGDAVAIASARGLTKIYGRGEAAVHALAGVDVDLVQGELTAIMGPSGSGKSTLMHCLAGLDRPTSGTVEVAGQDITNLGERALTKLRRTRLGFIFQAFNLVPTLTARENIRLPLEIARSKVDEEWFDTIVAAVGLVDRLGHRPAELSGGQQQRVACARALITKPALVFADEPTGNLDSAASAEVLGFLRRSVDELGQSVVMVTHEPFAAAYADRVLFLADGVIVGELRGPTPETVLEAIRNHASQPPVPYSAALDLAKFTPGAVEAFGGSVDAKALGPAATFEPAQQDMAKETAVVAALGDQAGQGADRDGGAPAQSDLEPRWKPQPPVTPGPAEGGGLTGVGGSLPGMGGGLTGAGGSLTRIDDSFQLGDGPLGLDYPPVEPAQAAMPDNAPVVYRDTAPAGIGRLLDIATGHNPPAMPAMPAVPGTAAPTPGPPTLLTQLPLMQAPVPSPDLGPRPPAQPPGGRSAPPGFDPTGVMPAISETMAAPPSGAPAPPPWQPGGRPASKIQVGSEPVTMMHPALQASDLGAAPFDPAALVQPAAPGMAAAGLSPSGLSAAGVAAPGLSARGMSSPRSPLGEALARGPMPPSAEPYAAAMQSGGAQGNPQGYMQGYSPYGAPMQPDNATYGAAMQSGDAPYGSAMQPANAPYGSAMQSGDAQGNQQANAPYGSAMQSANAPYGAAMPPGSAPYGAAMQPGREPSAAPMPPAMAPTASPGGPRPPDRSAVPPAGSPMVRPPLGDAGPITQMVFAASPNVQAPPQRPMPQPLARPLPQPQVVPAQQPQAAPFGYSQQGAAPAAQPVPSQSPIPFQRSGMPAPMQGYAAMPGSAAQMPSAPQMPGAGRRPSAAQMPDGQLPSADQMPGTAQASRAPQWPSAAQKPLAAGPGAAPKPQAAGLLGLVKAGDSVPSRAPQFSSPFFTHKPDGSRHVVGARDMLAASARQARSASAVPAAGSQAPAAGFVPGRGVPALASSLPDTSMPAPDPAAQGSAAGGFTAQGLTAQGLTAQGLTAQGLAAQNLAAQYPVAQHPADQQPAAPHQPAPGHSSGFVSDDVWPSQGPYPGYGPGEPSGRRDRYRRPT